MQLLVLQREEAPEDLAAEIYDSLNWSNDVPGLMSALRRAHPDRYNVQSAFEAEHGSIWSYLKDQLSIEQVIDAYAYFLHGHKHDLHVALARAILPSGTRDAEIHRILASVPVANRPALAEQYEADYWDLGEGTLRADLINDQSGWELEKSLSLLDHATTEAEQLYFDSVAITGTNTDAVIGRLQRIAASDDPNAFARLEEEWDRFVKTDEGWNVSRPSDLFEDAAGVDLRTAIESELSGEDAGFALAAIDNGRLRSESAAGAAPTGTEGAAGTAALTPEQVFADEELRLQMHMAYLRAAAEGAGTNEEQLFSAVEAIQQIWSARIRRAEAEGRADLAETYRSEWQAAQDMIRPIVNDEMDEEGLENLRVRLLLAGPLQPADEFYLATADYDDERAVEIVTRTWVKGEIDNLIAAAEEPRLDAEGRTLRPSFNPFVAQRVTSGTPFRRSAVLLNRDYSDSEKGAHRLKIEFDEGTGNDDCGRALAFLKSPGLDTARRNQIISTFVSIQGLGDRPEESDIEKLLGWVSERYEESSATWEMRDFLAPASTPEELLERAEGRHEAAHSGLLDEALTDFSRDWGHLTGEDTVEVEQESLERLRFMVTTATPAELEGMMALTGKTSLNELAAFEYGQYLERLQELRELKAAIAEGLSKAVELLAAAALTVATGGAASASMAVAIGSAIAGMFAREALLGTEYELVSEENAKALIVAAASAGVGTAIGPAAEGIKAMERLGTARGFLAGALTEGAKAVTTETLSAALSDARLTEDAFADIVVRTVGNTLAGGVSGRMTLGLEDIPIRDRILPTLQAQAVSSMVSGTADEVAAFSGRGDMSAGQFIGRLGARFARSLGEATIGTLGEIGAASGGAGPEAEGGETSGPEETGASGGGGEGADGEAGAPAASETDTGTAPLPVEPVMAAEGVPAGTGDPAAAAEAALTTAHEEAPPGGGAGEPPDRLFPGLSEGEFDFTALGPLDTRPAPGRSERAEVVGDLDRTNPLGASGFIGSTAGATPGAGAFATEVRTERGDVVDAVVKVLPVDARDTFEREVAGAKAAATTGIGPPFYGVVEVEDGLAFAMGRVPGGFTENYSLEAPGSPGHEAAATEAAAALSALSAQAPRDVRNYASALVHLGYYYSGECQGLIGPDGRWRPIDFSGISPLPSDPAAREAALREHHSNIEHEASGLERDLRAR